MIEDEIISFETAKLAKEKRCYIEECRRLYHKDFPVPKGDDSSKYLHYVINLAYWDWDEYAHSERIIACTQTTLAKYLREKHKLSVEVHYFNKGVFNYYISDMRHNDLSNDVLCRKGYDTYEEALEEGLKEALKLI